MYGYDLHWSTGCVCNGITQIVPCRVSLDFLMLHLGRCHAICDKDHTNIFLIWCIHMLFMCKLGICWQQDGISHWYMRVSSVNWLFGHTEFGQVLWYDLSILIFCMWIITLALMPHTIARHLSCSFTDLGKCNWMELCWLAGGLH